MKNSEPPRDGARRLIAGMSRLVRRGLATAQGLQARFDRRGRAIMTLEIDPVHLVERHPPGKKGL